MAADPYKYFRVEARELLDGLTGDVLELEKGVADRKRISNVLRLAHTLKGAARVVKQPTIAELAHGIEDILAPFRDDSETVPNERARAILQMLDQIGAGLAELGQRPERSAPVTARAVLAEPLETVRVEVEEVEALLARLSEADAELAVMDGEVDMVKRAKRQSTLLIQQLQLRREESGAVTEARVRTLVEQLQDSLQVLDRRLGESAERIARDFGQVRELASRLRLLPSSTIFPHLVRVVRDAAVTLGKQVQLEPAGGDIRLDAHVLAILRDALVQLVRNAVAHGIEDEPRRTAAGKAPCGRIDLRIERRGGRMAFLCRDDGAGIDLAAIRRVAVQKGVISAAGGETLGLREAIDLVFRGGLSTAGQVNEISGRGIGLDIVRAAVARLKGEISVETAPGEGTTVEICVPASLTSVLALTVDSGGVVASLPLDCVRQTLRIDRQEIARCGAHESISYQGQAIPFMPLSSALGAQESAPALRRRCSTVIVAAGPAMAAIGVDRLVGTGTELVRSLPALVQASPIVNGATVDTAGNVRLFLDPAGLVESANVGQRRLRPRDLRAMRVLVVDDSLTTRMVEQSILESAGYQVDLATSGEEALSMALAQRYNIFLVDVEMPGMDGFEFISRTRLDPVLRDIPAILVTSRMSPEDRRRGEEAGAQGYIVKGEFDQSYFLQTIQQLVNQ